MGKKNEQCVLTECFEIMPPINHRAGHRNVKPFQKQTFNKVSANGMSPLAQRPW